VIVLAGFEHVHVSEREVAHQGPCGWDDGKWENCLDVAVLEWLRATGHPEVPATHAEAEELRCASGLPPTGASDFARILFGVLERYDITLPSTVKGADAIWAALTPGKVAVVIGAGSPGGWQAGFTGGHAITVFRLDPVDAVWACDGLAPATYDGERLTKAQLFAYIAGQPNGGAIVGTVVAQKGADMIYVLPKTKSYDLLPDTHIFNQPGGADIGVDSTARRFIAFGNAATAAGALDASWTCIAGLKADGVTPDFVGPTLAGWVRTDRLTDPRDLPAVDCTAAVKAATDPLNAAIAAAELAGRRLEWDRQLMDATATNPPASVILAPRP